MKPKGREEYSPTELPGPKPRKGDNSTVSELLAAARELPFYEDLRGLGDAIFDRNAMSGTEAEGALMRTFRHFEKLGL